MAKQLHINPDGVDATSHRSLCDYVGRKGPCPNIIKASGRCAAHILSKSCAACSKCGSFTRNENKHCWSCNAREKVKLSRQSKKAAAAPADTASDLTKIAEKVAEIIASQSLSKDISGDEKTPPPAPKPKAAKGKAAKGKTASQ